MRIMIDKKYWKLIHVQNHKLVTTPKTSPATPVSIKGTHEELDFDGYSAIFLSLKDFWMFYI